MKQLGVEFSYLLISRTWVKGSPLSALLFCRSPCAPHTDPSRGPSGVAILEAPSHLPCFARLYECVSEPGRHHYLLGWYHSFYWPEARCGHGSAWYLRVFFVSSSRVVCDGSGHRMPLRPLAGPSCLQSEAEARRAPVVSVGPSTGDL